MKPSASETISHYRILNKLGEGGMREVYLAEDTGLGWKVAIKFIAAKAIEDQRAKKRFSERLFGSVSRYPSHKSVTGI